MKTEYIPTMQPNNENIWPPSQLYILIIDHAEAKRSFDAYFELKQRQCEMWCHIKVVVVNGLEKESDHFKWNMELTLEKQWNL